MCILCVLQEVSGRAKAMLPWLVVALSVLWGVSQLLPPPFRIDMTTARLACFLFLVAVALWQRVLRPQLCLWQARRSARLREERWTAAVELQKLRKIAIRRCRNCLTAYRDQNPCGGKFMCSYCGHISKRPVLDIPGTRNGGNGWNCAQDWSGEGRYWSPGEERCLTGKSYSDAAIVTCRLLFRFVLCVRCAFGKLFGFDSSREDGSTDADHKGLSKKGEGGGGYQESKGEKARRKAEEKRQARLEKEMLEEEERKQREEVARLIEERRKLRDEKLGPEKEQMKSSYSEKVRDAKKDSEKKKQERKKDRDKSSSKSNSDGEDLERRNSRESERKKDFDRKNDIEKRDFQKACIESIRSQILEGTAGLRTNANKPRYLDRMAGSFLSSSRGFSGANFFRKGAPASSLTKQVKLTASPGDQTNTSIRKEGHSSGSLAGTNTSIGEDKSGFQQSVTCNHPPTNVWKKSWQQLFTCSSSVSPSPNANATSYMAQNVQSTQFNDHQTSSAFPPLNQVNFGQLHYLHMDPFISDHRHGSKSNNPFFGVASHPLNDSVSEEPELFEDPCYVPDPLALLVPVSESLDNFPVDLGSGFVSNTRREISSVHRNLSTYADVKPSPIESPMTRLRMSREKPSPIGQVSGSPRARDSRSLQRDDATQLNEQGTWQMWDTPLGLDHIVSGSASRLLPVAQNKVNQDNMSPYAPRDNHVYPGMHSNLNSFVGNYQMDAPYAPLGTGFNEEKLWPQKIFLEFPGDAEKNLPADLSKNITPVKPNYDDTDRLVEGRHVLNVPSDSWSKSDWGVPGFEEVESDNTSPKPHVGGPFPADPDVQSVWTFK